VRQFPSCRPSRRVFSAEAPFPRRRSCLVHRPGTLLIPLNAFSGKGHPGDAHTGTRPPGFSSGPAAILRPSPGNVASSRCLGGRDPFCTADRACKAVRECGAGSRLMVPTWNPSGGELPLAGEGSIRHRALWTLKFCDSYSVTVHASVIRHRRRAGPIDKKKPLGKRIIWPQGGQPAGVGRGGGGQHARPRGREGGAPVAAK